jgi:hypothetical protein
LFFRKKNSKEILPELVEKIKQLYVLFALTNCYYIIASFDLGLSKEAEGIFALVIKFLGAD